MTLFSRLRTPSGSSQSGQHVTPSGPTVPASRHSVSYSSSPSSAARPLNLTPLIMRLTPLRKLHQRIVHVRQFRNPLWSIVVWVGWIVVCRWPAIGHSGLVFYIIWRTKRWKTYSMANRKDGEIVGVGGEHYSENMQFLQHVIASYTSLHDTVLHVVKSALQSDFAPQYLLLSIPATWISYFVVSQVGWSWAWCWIGLWVLGAGRALPNGNKVDAGLGITSAVDLSALTNQLTRTIDVDMRWFDNISTFLAALPTAVQRIHGGPSVPSTSERRDSGHHDGDVEPETLFISMMENQRWWAGPGWIPHLLPEERSAFTTASPPYTPLPAPFPPTVAPTLPPAVALALPSMSNASSLAVTDPALVDTAIFHAFKLDPARYVFSSDWKVDMSWTATDSQGWVYTDHQWMNPTAKASLCSLTRRRRWMRSLRSLKRDLPFAAEARTQ